MRTRVKICGLTRAEDVRAAVAAGADAIGLVFYPESPRAMGVEAARTLLQDVPPWVARVGLFVNASRVNILETAREVGLSHLQLHGDESPADCQGLGLPVIKAIRVSAALAADSAGLIKLVSAFRGCAGILFDSDSAGFGGSGEAFDWNALLPLREHLGSRWVLSGGLGPENVSRAIAQLVPPAVDVSSGVEQRMEDVVQKGVKDALRIDAFMTAVAEADRKRRVL
ncbi:MAG: N-(5-phosphoribosyl)anthranilate isomerase [Pseudomonadota bacterium]